MAPPGEKGDYAGRSVSPLPASLSSEPYQSSDLGKQKPGIVEEVRNSSRGITPYLGLPGRLSQIWLNRWTVLILLVLARMMFLIADLNNSLANAQTDAVAACSKVEDIGSAMASMPHYLSVGVNSLAAKGITDAVHGLMDALDLILTAVAELIYFVVEMMTSTYTCLLTAVVHGGLNVTADVVNDTTTAMNSAIHGIADDINSAASSLQNDLNSIFSKINSATSGITSTLGSLFGSGGTSLSTPSVNFTSQVSSLENIHIDSSGFVADIVKVNTAFPTFAQVQNETKNVINIPFNLVKKALNSTYGNYQFDESVFPVAQKTALSFCSDNSTLTDFFAELFKIVATAKTVFIVIFVLLAILACVPMAWIEIRRWRKQQQYAKLFGERKFDDMDLVYMSSRPFTARLGMRIADKLCITRNKWLLVRWCVAYGTSLPAIFVLSLAIAGFFSCFCQFIVIKAIEKAVPALADEVGDFAGEVVSTLNNVSVNWANDANGVILNVQNEINNDVLGYVVNATTAVNNTLNTFTADLSDAINLIFNNTILKAPIEDVVYCLIGLRVASVEKGLTWVHDHANVSLPTFPNDTFSAGASKSISGDSGLSTFLASPSSVTSDDITAAVTKVTDALQSRLVQEFLLSFALFLVYIIVVLLGVVRAATAAATTPRTRGTGGGPLTGDNRVPLSPRRTQEDPAFPTFGGSTGDVTAHPDAYSAFDRHDDFGAAGSVRGGAIEKQAPVHARSSSYGFVSDAKY